MQTKHTPGPWHADWLTVYHAGRTVADCCPKAANGIPLEEKESNAILIAAAPELLEACRAALEAIECQYPQVTGWADLQTMLRAAIAKAETP